MNTHTPFDTGNSCCTANNDQIVDHLIGNAYQVVKFVAMRMPYIKTLSDNIDKLIAIAYSLDKLNALQAKLPELLALREKLAQLMALYDHLDELLLISSNMTPLLTLYNNLDKINTLYTNIVAIQTVAQNIQAVLTVHNNIAAILNVNTNMATIKAVEAKLPELSNISTNLDAALADNTAFKSATGSSKIGHTPTTGDATTVEAELKAIRTLAAGKQNPATTLSGYGITDAYTNTEADNKLTQKVDKTAALGGGGDPTDAKASRALSNWYTNTAARPIQVTMAVNPEAAGGCVLSGYVRSAAGQTQFLVGATTLNGLTTSDRVAVSFLVPAGWQFQVDHFNAGVITSWTEF